MNAALTIPTAPEDERQTPLAQSRRADAVPVECLPEPAPTSAPRFGILRPLRRLGSLVVGRLAALGRRGEEMRNAS